VITVQNIVARTVQFIVTADTIRSLAGVSLLDREYTFSYEFWRANPQSTVARGRGFPRVSRENW
jgi:hypothetical protein